MMPIATRTASIIEAIHAQDNFEDTTVTEVIRSANVPIHFVERIVTDKDGQSLKWARVRLPSRYVINPGDVLLVGTDRWSVLDELSARSPGAWTVVNCTLLQA